MPNDMGRAFEAVWSLINKADMRESFGTHRGVNYEISLTEYDDLQCLIHFGWGTVSEDDFSTLEQAHRWARKTIEEVE